MRSATIRSPNVSCATASGPNDTIEVEVGDGLNCRVSYFGYLINRPPLRSPTQNSPVTELTKMLVTLLELTASGIAACAPVLGSRFTESKIITRLLPASTT